MHRLRVAVAANGLACRGQRVVFTCSFGLSDATAGETLAAEAEDALRRAKDGGRNRVEAPAPPVMSLVH